MTRVLNFMIVLVGLLSFGSIAVGKVANASESGSESGLTHWWPADGTRTDVIGGATASGVGGVTYSAGKIGEAFAISPSHFIKLPAEVGNFETNNFTIVFWLKTGMIGTPSVLIGKGSDFSHRFSLKLNEAGIPHLEIKDGINVLTITGTNPMNDNTWHRLAVVREGLIVSLYSDDALEGNNSSHAGALLNFGDPGYTVSPLFLGSDPLEPEMTFQGDLDDMMIYNRALSQADLSRCAPPDLKPMPVSTCDELVAPTHICGTLPERSRSEKLTKQACLDTFESETDRYLQVRDQCEISLRREGNSVEDENELSFSRYRECILHTSR